MSELYLAVFTNAYADEFFSLKNTPEECIRDIEDNAGEENLTAQHVLWYKCHPIFPIKPPEKITFENDK